MFYPLARRFLRRSIHLRDLPKLEVPEVAFAGRSNGWKINCNQYFVQSRSCASPPKTGRTQHINFFLIGGAHGDSTAKDETRQDEIQRDVESIFPAMVATLKRQELLKIIGTSCSAIMCRSVNKLFDLDHGCASSLSPISTYKMLEWFAPIMIARKTLQLGPKIKQT